MEDTDNGKDYACVEVGGTWEISVMFPVILL